jgi:DNA repair exonuclease SbcCD ATPase subunit
MKSLASVTAFTSLTLLTSAIALAQPAAPEQALRELNIMRNIFNAALEESSENRRSRIREPEVLYLSGQGMVFTFDMPNGSAYFDFNADDYSMFSEGDFNFSFDFDYDEDSIFDRASEPQEAAKAQAKEIAKAQAIVAQQAKQAQQAEQARANQSQAVSDYRAKLQDVSQQMRDKQEVMRDLQSKMRTQQRAQQRAQQNNDETDFDEAAMKSLGAEMGKVGDEIKTLSNSMNQTRQAYEAERKTVAAELRKQQAAVIFDTLCNYGNTLRSLKNGEHVNLVLRSRSDNLAQVYVIDYSKLANCSAGSALQQAATAYSLPGK